MYEQGATVAEILETTDMSYDRVLRLLKEKGVYKTKSRSRADSSKERIMELLDMEADAMKLAREMHLPYLVVKSVASEKKGGKRQFEYGGKYFDSFNEVKLFKQQTGIAARMLALEGKSRVEIAEQLGISMKSAGRFLKSG